MTRFKTTGEYKRKLVFSPRQSEVLVGLLLGDGCLATRKDRSAYYLRIEQSSSHEEYVHHLYSIFQEWTLNPPKYRQGVYKHGRYTGRIYEKWGFTTFSHDAFSVYGQQFYVDGKKKVPRQIEEWLTPCGLAYWYMDDGSIKSKDSKGVIFNTQAFCRDDVERLSQLLQIQFGLRASVRVQRDGYQIYVSGKSYERFVELTSSYVIPSMAY
jgi:hypothetical protein